MGVQFLPNVQQASIIFFFESTTNMPEKMAMFNFETRSQCMPTPPIKFMHENGNLATQNRSQYRNNGKKLQHFKVGYFSVLIEMHIS